MNATMSPSRKIRWSALAGTFTTIVIFGLNGYVPFFAVKPISGEFAAALITFVSTIVGYLVAPAATETVVVEDGVTKSARS